MKKTTKKRMSKAPPAAYKKAVKSRQQRMQEALGAARSARGAKKKATAKRGK